MNVLNFHGPLKSACYAGRGRAFIVVAVFAAVQMSGILPEICVAGERKSVVELFTSQGCSSCPPADVILGKFAQRPDVVALTLPVSYWDHLGWKDTLALEANNERQRAYAEARGDHEIYTPQVVVNGLAHVIGSHAEEIDAALAHTNGTLGGPQIALSLTAGNGEIVLSADAVALGDAPREGVLWVAFYTSAISVEISDGDNIGQKLTYTNVVRALAQAGKWNGEAVSYRVQVPAVSGIDGCAALLQGSQPRGVLGAAVLPLPSKIAQP